MASESESSHTPPQTFLFADLAGFTALTEAHGDERAADLVGAFCSQARELLPEHGGEEIKAIGDALMIRVASAPQAVQLALRLTREVGGRHGFPGVRVGLHTGSAVQRGNDWFGSTVNIAARVSSIALSGEVLLSEVTRAASADNLASVEFRARGPQRLKNVAQPIEVFLAAPAGELTTTERAVDPVCQMSVDANHAAASRKKRGRELVFCSEACAQTFDEAPDRFLSRRASSAELRASDRGREHAARLLRSAYERGRLELEELEERSAHVHAARTRSELSAALRDLPEYRRWRARTRRRGFWLSLLPRPLRRRFGRGETP